MIKDLLRTIAWLLPASPAKNRLLTAWGHQVHPTAVARSCLVLRVDEFAMAPHARLGRFNVFRDMRSVRLGTRCSVGRLNVVLADPRWKDRDTGGAFLVLEESSTITSRHRLDCTGGATIAGFAIVAGHESRFFSLDAGPVHGGYAARPISIGERSFIGARCNVLAGAAFPELSVLAAGSVYGPQAEAPEPGVWAGNPARRKGGIEGKWFRRDTTSTRSVYIPGEDRIEDNAL